MSAKQAPDEAVWFGKPLSAGRSPIKKNLFEEVINASGTLELVPVFPYFHDGALVPCLSVSTGRPGTGKFQFLHDNVVPEVLICLADHKGSIRAGQMMALPNLHAVNNFIKDVDDEDAYVVVLITIRINREDEQREGFIVRCKACNALVYERYLNLKEVPQPAFYPVFSAIGLYADAADEFNASDRACPECGAVQDPLPVDQLGWRRYVSHARVANRARESAENLARGLRGEARAEP
jgi:hypothetical protein